MTVEHQKLTRANLAATRADTTARPQPSGQHRPTAWELGEIVAADAGRYDLWILDESGERRRKVNRVRPADPGADFGVGDIVLCLVSPGFQQVIIAPGGSCACGEHYFQGPSDGGFAGMVAP